MEYIQNELTKLFGNITLQDFKNRHVNLMPLLELK